jgi:hypothetical protein
VSPWSSTLEGGPNRKDRNIRKNNLTDDLPDWSQFTSLQVM